MTAGNGPGGAGSGDAAMGKPGAAAELGLPEGYQTIRTGVLRLVTETGSHYEIDLDAGRWSRVPTLASGPLRSETGPLRALHVGGLGESAVLECPPLVSYATSRLIVTSPLVAIDDVGPAAAPAVEGSGSQRRARRR